MAEDRGRSRWRWRAAAGRWREMAGDGGRRRRAAAAVGRGVQACAWAGAAEGAAEVAAAWWVKLLQSRYARASSYACTCARGCEVVSGGECRVS
jgi:hypothetical protein